MSRKISILILIAMFVLACLCIARVYKIKAANTETEVTVEVVELTEQKVKTAEVVNEKNNQIGEAKEEKPVGKPKQATHVKEVTTQPPVVEKTEPETITAPKEEPPVATSIQNVTQYEKDIIAKLVWLEARGESDNGQMAVVEVILNRVLSAQFPDTIEGVIYQSGQFAPASQISSVSATEREYRNVEYVLGGGRVIGDTNVCFFSTGTQPGRPIWGKIDGHYFQYL